MSNLFDDCSYLSQTRKLRTLAVDALKKYPIEKYGLKFINHGENATFKVETNTTNYLLRIHCRGHRTKEAFLEELKWLRVLSEKTDIPVQRPFLSKDKKLIVNIENEQRGHSRYVDVLEWQKGYIKNKRTPDTFLEVGKLIGNLQKHSIKSKHRNYWDAKGLIGKNATLGSLSALDNDFPKYSLALESLRSELFKKISNYEKNNSDRLSLIHADLHFGNMIWNKGIVQPIDFDDCGYGLELYDLAVTLAQSSFFFKKVGKRESFLSKRALLEGYCIYKQLTKSDLKVLPYLIAAREVAMIGWLYERRDNPKLFKYLKKNLGKRIKKTSKYIEHAEKGTYFK